MVWLKQSALILPFATIWLQFPSFVSGERPGAPATAGLGAVAFRANRSLRNGGGTGGSGGSGASRGEAGAESGQTDSTQSIAEDTQSRGTETPEAQREEQWQEPQFCDVDTATDMSMEGFRTMASFANGKGPCVILLFGSWTLRTSVQFKMGCLFSASLGLMMQATADILRRTERHCAPKLLSGRGLKERICVAVLYFVQMSLAYLCMLIAMTYQAELFCSVCVGLALGYVIFGFSPSSIAHQSQGFSRHEPCCSAEPSAVNEFSGVDVYKDVELRRVRAGPATVPQE